MNLNYFERTKCGEVAKENKVTGYKGNLSENSEVILQFDMVILRSAKE